MSKKDYSLENWKDLQQHFKMIGLDGVKAEFKYVEKEGAKIREHDLTSIKKKFSIEKNEKADVI